MPRKVLKLPIPPDAGVARLFDEVALCLVQSPAIGRKPGPLRQGQSIAEKVELISNGSGLELVAPFKALECLQRLQRPFEQKAQLQGLLAAEGRNLRRNSRRDGDRPRLSRQFDIGELPRSRRGPPAPGDSPAEQIADAATSPGRVSTAAGSGGCCRAMIAAPTAAKDQMAGAMTTLPVANQSTSAVRKRTIVTPAGRGGLHLQRAESHRQSRMRPKPKAFSDVCGASNAKRVPTPNKLA